MAPDTGAFGRSLLEESRPPLWEVYQSHVLTPPDEDGSWEPFAATVDEYLDPIVFWRRRVR